MSASDIFFLIVRWLHLLAAASWIGGSIFYLTILRPGLRKPNQSIRNLNNFTIKEFRALVNCCIVILIATGVILGADRLTVGVVNLPYVATLGTKTLLSIVMFALVWDLQKQSRNARSPGIRIKKDQSRFRSAIKSFTGYNAIVVVGIIIFLLSDLLKVLFEMALVSR